MTPQAFLLIKQQPLKVGQNAPTGIFLVAVASVGALAVMAFWVVYQILDASARESTGIAASVMHLRCVAVGTLNGATETTAASVELSRMVSRQLRSSDPRLSSLIDYGGNHDSENNWKLNPAACSSVAHTTIGTIATGILPNECERRSKPAVRG